MIEVGSRLDFKAAANAFIAANFDGDVSIAWQAVLPSLAVTKTLIPHEAHILRPRDPEQICWICGHKASQAARQQFKNLLHWIETLPENFTYAKTRDALHKTRMLKRSQKYRCKTFLEALGLIRVLSTPDYPGILAKETSFAELDRRPNKNVEATRAYRSLACPAWR